LGVVADRVELAAEEALIDLGRLAGHHRGTFWHSSRTELNASFATRDNRERASDATDASDCKSEKQRCPSL
jgi:hypothetical protein